jgi:hypothetical protein
MSYEPSHRRLPPRQARWPHATPQEGWPAYRPGDGDWGGGQARELQAADDRGWAADGYRVPDGYARAGNGHAQARNSHAQAGNGHAQAGNGHAQAGNGYARAGNGYAQTLNGYEGGYAETSHPWNNNGHDRYGEAWDGYGGYAGASGAFAGSAGFPDQLDRAEYAEPRPSGPLLIAPDTIGEPAWLRDQSEAPRRGRDRSQLIIGAVTGTLAAAVAIGFATLAAAFVRPQASPVIAVGGAFIDRAPPALKNFAVEHFGENGTALLLLGMYVMIALIAVAVGCLARQRGVTIGVAGIAALGLLGAFVAITRPGSRPTDVIPSVIGVIAGVTALLWLDRRAAPLAPLQPARRGGGRRAR